MILHSDYSGPTGPSFYIICSPAAPQYVNFQYSRYEPSGVIITCGPHPTDRDPSSISISTHLREELHRTSSRDLSKQCRLCFETLLYISVWLLWRRIGELGHGLPGSLSKTGLQRQGRDKGPHGVWPNLRFGFVWFKHICTRRGGPTGPREPHSPKGLGPCMNPADRTIFRPKIIAHDTGLHLIGRKCTDSN